MKKIRLCGLILLFICFLSSCGGREIITVIDENDTVTEVTSQENTKQDTPNHQNTKIGRTESFESKISKLQKYADDENEDTTVKERIKSLLEWYNANKNAVTEENIEEYENELLEISEILDIPDYETPDTSDELFLEQNENIIMTLGDDGAYYKLDNNNDSITVFNSERVIINEMHLTEDEEQYSVFTDEKGNEFVLSKSEDGQLIFTDSTGDTKVLSEINE